jgi:hypothetical protein
MASLLPGGEKDRLRGRKWFRLNRRSPLTLPSPPLGEGLLHRRRGG